MIKEVKYRGYSASPSDYDNQDGELAVAMNIFPKNGSLGPAIFPRTELTSVPGIKVVYIHEGNGFKHYICYEESTRALTCRVPDSQAAIGVLPLGATLHQVISIGNTIIALTSMGMEYYLWKRDESKYLFLGNHLPECPISFGLQGELIDSEEFEFDWGEFMSLNDIFLPLPEKVRKTVTENVLSKVNKFIAENSTQKGRFLYPFFVRYAYRLYDGSLTMHSSPVLMVCSSDLAPNVRVRAFMQHDATPGHAHGIRASIMGVLHELDYAIASDGFSKMLLQDWGDIIKSVDIFVSAPIYTYDQNGECKRLLNAVENDSYSICKLTNQTADEAKYPVRYQKHTMIDMRALVNNNFSQIDNLYIELPRKSQEQIKENIRSCSQFYLLRSLKIEELSTERTVLKVDESYLQSLLTREVMTDDYDSHDKLIPGYAFGYNGRLNLCGIQKDLFPGFTPFAMLPYTDGLVMPFNRLLTSLAVNPQPRHRDRTWQVTLYVYIKQDGKNITVESGTAELGCDCPLLYFYYPNTNAYKVAIKAKDGPFSSYYEVTLEPSSFLNGAFCFIGWQGIEDHAMQEAPSPSASARVSLLNKIYTSDVNNPFYFPVLGINTVGTERIIGISTAAKALSEGQFGQFPLYAFTTEGVWALEVSSTGSYSARQPITRDVCINADSITQIDSAVLFSTDRGIMLLSGSTATCISEQIDSHEVFALNDTLLGPQIMEIAGLEAETSVTGHVPFKEFLADCGIIYDYINQRIILYNPSKRYSYVYSFGTKAWGMMHSEIAYGLKSYPEAYAITQPDEDNGESLLVNYSVIPDKDTEVPTLIATRPLRLDMPDVHKTIDTVIQRGRFRKQIIKQVLYGSRDLIEWFPVYSSKNEYLRGFRGTPYKYFRLVVAAKLRPSESLSGCTIQFTPKLLNQPR